MIDSKFKSDPKYTQSFSVSV